jgi:hypothetical protein
MGKNHGMVSIETLIMVSRLRVDTRIADNLLPWPRDGDSQLIIDLANKEYHPSSFLNLNVLSFLRKFVVSPTAISRFLLTHDYTLGLCDAWVMAYLEVCISPAV